MTPPAPSPSAERTLVVRIAVALGLALLLVVGAWSDSHHEVGSGMGTCLAVGAVSASASDHHDVEASPGFSSDAGTIGACAVVVFVLVALFLRLSARRTTLAAGRAPSASAPPRAGPAAFIPTVSLTRISVSRT